MKLAALGKVVSKSKFALHANSPKIKVVGGVAVMVIGAVWLAKKAVDSQPVVDDMKTELNDNRHDFEIGDIQSKKGLQKLQTETVVHYGKKLVVNYAAPMATMACGGFLILNGFGELNGRYVKAVATAGAFNDILQKYRGRVANELGDDKEKDLYHGVIYKDIEVRDSETGELKEIKKAPVLPDISPDLPLSPLGAVFKERDVDKKLGSKLFTKGRNDLNILALKQAQMSANDRLQTDGFMTLYTLLTDYLRMDPQALGDPSMALNWGWKYTKNNSDPTSDNYIDFGVWDAYYNFKDDVVEDFYRGYEKYLFLEFNAVPLFKIDKGSENKLTDILTR